MTMPLSGMEGNIFVGDGIFNGRAGSYGTYNLGPQFTSQLHLKMKHPLGATYSGVGDNWLTYPYMISGASGFAGVSTDTGVPMGTPDVGAETGKIGGGAAGADSSAGETPATTTGMSQGGTAAY